jgi:hypothetical protein
MYEKLCTIVGAFVIGLMIGAGICLFVMTAIKLIKAL